MWIFLALSGSGFALSAVQLFTAQSKTAKVIASVGCFLFGFAAELIILC